MVVVEGDYLSAESFNACPEFAAAGLEVKPNAMLDPRLIVHGVPVELTKEEIVECIKEQNLPEDSTEVIKMTYLYPAKEKKARSCIVEVSPETRTRLLARRRINVRWSVCRVEDYVSVTQCFRCAGFGHIASACKSNARCSHCAGEHIADDCTKKDPLKCVNCSEAAIGDCSHSARDKGKCSILRKKLEHKVASINYGY